jgi:hypothetical protein
MRDAVTTGGNALPKDDPPDVTRFKAAAAKRVQAHRWRRRLGLQCLTVRVNDRPVRHLISTGYLSLESVWRTEMKVMGMSRKVDVYRKNPKLLQHL